MSDRAALILALGLVAAAALHAGWTQAAADRRHATQAASPPAAEGGTSARDVQRALDEALIAHSKAHVIELGEHQLLVEPTFTRKGESYTLQETYYEYRDGRLVEVTTGPSSAPAR